MVRLLCLARNLLLLISIFSIFACQSAHYVASEYVYFQNNLDSLGKVHYNELTIQPNDLLSIFVYSKSLNQDQAAIFNMAPTQGVTGGGGAQTSGTGSSSSGASSGGNSQGYLVAPDGKIEMPIIGLVNAAGLTRLQLQNEVRERVLPYVKDPAVIVRITNFTVNVLGEVKTPGLKNFPTDKVTIIDAISAAGDLTDVGKRENVKVIREDRDGQRRAYIIDLRSAGLFQSPVYQLQQNDIVYVEPNRSKMKNLEEKPNMQGFQLVMSFVGIASTLLLLFRTL